MKANYTSRAAPLNYITNIDVRQGPAERIFGFGKIWMFTPSTGANTPETRLVGVTNPHGRKQTIVDRIETVRQAKETADVSADKPAGEVVALLSEIRDSLKKIELILDKKAKDKRK